jgi:hypothetical protein
MIGLDHILTERDLAQIRARGATLEHIEHQLVMFHEGIPFAQLDRPCILNDGMISFQPQDLDHFASLFEQAQSTGRFSKFVPASGAASRMFKALLPFLTEEKEQGKPETQSIQKTDYSSEPAIQQLCENLQRFAFYPHLESALQHQHFQISNLFETGNIQPILQHLLTHTGLNYAALPKGLLYFHSYPSGPRTPVEEHLVEAAAYTIDRERRTTLHFTISPEHRTPITNHIEDLCQRLANQGIAYVISCSEQQFSTDTIAVDENNHPFRDRQGNVLFRPSGHGALLDNLNNFDGDLVFIKNIDNVVPDRLKPETFVYKKAMGGLLVFLQQQIATYLIQLAENKIDHDQLPSIVQFMKDQLSISLPLDLDKWPIHQQLSFVQQTLNRPIRVCGMVKNTGEPGGGPFWVTHADGSQSRQIVETSQIDPESPTQQHILQNATHFNPVDMVCAIRDFRGQPFDLTQFRDPRTGFISHKSHEGRELKALELPGLWNGAMANWITIFVEVPLSTFNPVKTLFDLLRPEHQPS